jgi:hypothetical protein
VNIVADADSEHNKKALGLKSLVFGLWSLVFGFGLWFWSLNVELCTLSLERAAVPLWLFDPLECQVSETAPSTKLKVQRTKNKVPSTKFKDHSQRPKPSF